MKIAFGSRRAGILLLVSVLFFGGCGYKTLPVPPETIVPLAINDLRYSVNEKGVTLTWSYPDQTVKGTDLTDVASFEVYRAVVPLDSYCSTCPIPFGDPIVVPGGMTGADGKRKGVYESALLRSGEKYFFMVRSRTSWWAASPDSNIVTFVWHMPAKAPEGLTVESGDRSIRLKWQPTTQLMDGQPLDLPVWYQVSRSVDGKSFENIGEAGKATAYTDNGVKNGQQYFYRVQSVLKVDGNGVGGGTSEVASIVPVDQTPPDVPTGVTVVATARGVKVFWEKVTTGDLQGYRLYRRAPGQQKKEHIGDVEAIYTIFEDTSVAADKLYSYSVTAFDAMNPANESKHSAEATVRQ